MEAMRFGCVPIVRHTGGLADTVPDIDEDPNGLGLKFRDDTPVALAAALLRAERLFLQDPDRLLAIRRRGMTRDFGWPASAKRYVDFYDELLVA